MNEVVLKLDPYKNLNMVSLNHHHLSAYSELNNFMKQPFFAWADQFFDAVEREINDDFHLSVCSEEFEKMFFQDMSEMVDECITVGTAQFRLNTPVKERLAILEELKTRYPDAADGEKQGVSCYVERDEGQQMQEGFYRVADYREAFVILAAGEEHLEEYIDDGSQHIILLEGPANGLQKIGGSFVWVAVKDRIPRILDAARERFFDIPYIVDEARKLGTRAEVFTPEEREKFEIIQATTPFIAVDEIPSIETGRCFYPSYRIIPEGEGLPHIRLVSLNEEILRTDGGILSGVKPGRTILEFYREEENLPFERREVTVFYKHTVRQIQLTLAAPVMGVNYRQTIGVILSPPDADDVNRLTWTSSNPAVATVSADGSVVSHAPGRCRITLSGEDAQASVELEIRPQLQTVELPVDEVECFVGETVPINVSVAPPDAFNKKVEWWTSDKMVAVVETTETGNFRIRGIGIGECTLTCRAVEGRASDSLEMKVYSTLQRKKKRWLFS